MSSVQNVAELDLEPAWEIARLFPLQGTWDEADYFALPVSRGVELADGRVEILPMPTEVHQLILGFLYRILDAFVSSRGLGITLPSGMRVRLRSGKFREPDVLFMRAENRGRRHEQFWDGADLVVEIVSPDDPDRDLVVKRSEYAEAGISEYWIVDPRTERLTVLKLADGTYAVHGEFASGSTADSPLLAGLVVDVAAVFAAGRA